MARVGWGEGGVSLQSRGGGYRLGGDTEERNFLREPLPLAECITDTNLVQNLGKCRWTPMFPPEIFSSSSPTGRL